MSPNPLTRPPRVLFLTKFTALNAAVRYRAVQYFPFLREAGFECAIAPLFGDGYLKGIYGSGSRRQALVRLLPEISSGMARRWWQLIRAVPRYDVVYVQYESLPYAPLFCEQALFRSGARVVVDYDDAVSVNYEQHPNHLLRRMLRSKIPGIVAQSCQVIAANKNVADWASRFNPSVTLIPNSLDLTKYPVDTPQARPNGVPMIGWIGTPVTARHLRLLERPLQRLRTRHPFVLKVIGVPGFKMDGVEVLALPWTEVSEIDELRSCDIGIMPLPDDAWARGKSALKLIQYLASGVAAVASPVGANSDVLQGGWNGLLATSDEEWTEQLASLIERPAYRERLARAGRRTVEEHYSLHRNAPCYVEVFRRAASA